MVHTVLLDDTTINGRKYLRELSRYRKGVEIIEPEISGVVEQTIPRGYMSIEEFRPLCMNMIDKLCDNYSVP